MAHAQITVLAVFVIVSAAVAQPTAGDQSLLNGANILCRHFFTL
jgi:hypothetical protein